MSGADLKSRLQEKLVGQVVIFCVGSRSRGDDIYGSLVAKQLSGKVKANVIDAENVPENYLGKVTKLKPNTVLLIDSANFSGQPGQIELLDPQNLDESSFSTHSASLRLIQEYLQAECDSKVMLLAAQPKHVRFGVPPSPEIVAAVDQTTKMLTEILGDAS